ncbi:ribonuclease H-like domain-containing protein [Tanacetum coccineum]|uniref:Ribonuclease H-like domain-containing protein n=1 Tax=Tanacetum coccineum TaxID=301880 RepID=A0ABQ4XVD6_9ASTR
MALSSPSPSSLVFNDFSAMLFEPVSIQQNWNSIFHLSQGTRQAYLLIYVDDIFLTASSTSLLQTYISLLHARIICYDQTLAIKLFSHGVSATRLKLTTRKKIGPEGSRSTVYVFTCMILENQTPFNASKCSLYLRGTPDLDYKFFGCIYITSLLSYSDVTGLGSAEDEYHGVVNVVAETSWIRNLFCELHTLLFTTTLVYCDNVSAVYMSANPVQHQRTRHIEIDIHFIRDKVAAGHVRVLHVPSRFQYTYIFTKGLPYPLFADFRSSLSIRKTPAPTAGAY